MDSKNERMENSKRYRHDTHDQVADQTPKCLKMLRSVKDRVSKFSGYSYKTFESLYSLRTKIREDGRAQEPERLNDSQWDKKQAETKEQIECVSCVDKFKFSEVTRIFCSHTYCRGCVTKMFELFAKGEVLVPPRCCGKPIAGHYASYILQLEMSKDYQDRILEFNDDNKLYCSNTSCYRYISSSQRNRRVGVCEHCMARTCKMCRARGHFGPCQEESIDSTRRIKRRTTARSQQANGLSKVPRAGLRSRNSRNP